MAYRLQRGAVRRTRHTAHGGVRALRRAALGLALALALPASASAQAPAANRLELSGSGAESASGWWGAPGRAGWLPDADFGTGYPWSLAGFVVGAWTLEASERPTTTLPPPGVVGAKEPLNWSDTLNVQAGEGGAWDGFGAALARAETGPGLMERRGGDRRPRSDLLLGGGSHAYGDHALTLWRGDSLGGLRLSAASGSRGPSGALASAGRDLYDVSGAAARGAHMVEAAFAHRRSEATLVGGETQGARGEGGFGGYRYQGRRWRASARFERGYDQHSGSGGGWPLGLRLAEANAAAIEIERGGPLSSLEARWAWSDLRVRHELGGGSREGGPAQWVAARWRGPFGDGRLEAALGLGRLDRLGGTRLAPSLAWRFSGRPWDGRLTLERILAPIRTDLAAGQSPFVQDTWVGGIEVGGQTAGGGRVRVNFLAGRARDRALLVRFPLETFALRSGYRADAHRYDFGLLMGAAEWRWSGWGVGLEGFALARDSSPLQPRVDPGRGGRAFVHARFSLFQGDLRVRPRFEAAAIGPRETEASPSHTLAGYVTFAAGLDLTLADAVMAIEERELAGRARPQTWVDAATGVEALGPGRELRATFTWRLWD